MQDTFPKYRFLGIIRKSEINIKAILNDFYRGDLFVIRIKPSNDTYLFMFIFVTEV